MADTNATDDRIRRILLDAWAHPTRKACFYTGAAVTGSNRLNAMRRWDWTPVRWRGVTGSSTIMFPLALGCPAVRTSEGGEWLAPIFTRPDQVDAFVAPDVHTGRTGEVLRSLQAVLDETGPRGIVVMADIQSPLQVAELMWDESFYIALIEAPDAVCALLDKVTAFIVEFIREFQRLAGERLNAAGWPSIWSDHVGTMVSDDTMSLLSPAMHRQFSVPYLNRIAEACGPLIYHSCTWRRRYFDNIHAIGPVKSYNWNPGNSDDPAELIREFSGRALIAPHLCLDMHRDNDVLALNKGFADEAEFFEYHLDCMRDDTCMYWYFSNIVQKGPVMERIYDLLDARGYTPAAWRME